MLTAIRRPLLSYDLEALSTDGVPVLIGRDGDSVVCLDSPEIPCLLSRKHANIIKVGPSEFSLVDLGSTNGTFASRQNKPLQKLPPGYAWTLEHGDTIGFGGPETIIVKRAQVGNPFLFKYYGLDQNTPRAALTAQHVPSALPLLSAAQVNLQQTLQHSHPQPMQMDVTTSQPDQDAILQGLRIPNLGLHQTTQNVQPAQPPSQENEVQQAVSDQACDMLVDCEPVQQPPKVQIHVKPAVMATFKSPARHISRPTLGSLGSPGTVSRKLTDILSSHLSCPVCCDWLLASHTLPCGHMFCGLCLATWVTQNQSCPSCRKAITGMPVRCFQVDATISELLSVQCSSPSAGRERKRKQEHWDNIQKHIMQDWAAALQKRKETALLEAQRHNQELQNQSVQRQAAHLQAPVDAAAMGLTVNLPAVNNVRLAR